MQRHAWPTASRQNSKSPAQKTPSRIRLPQKKYTPALWKHNTLPVHFILVVDDFGIKFGGEEHLQHLIVSLKTYYEIDINGGI